MFEVNGIFMLYIPLSHSSVIYCTSVMDTSDLFFFAKANPSYLTISFPDRFCCMTGQFAISFPVRPFPDTATKKKISQNKSFRN